MQFGKKRTILSKVADLRFISMQKAISVIISLNRKTILYPMSDLMDAIEMILGHYQWGRTY